MNPSQSSIGTPELPIAQAFVKSVLELVAGGVAQLKAKRVIGPNSREDTISQHLNDEMECLYRGSHSDIVNWSMRPVRTIPGTPQKTFEVDFSFYFNTFPRDQRRYLAVEAKRLRGRGASLASTYVKQGVLRFVKGKYSLGHDHAVMLGYVVVPPFVSAIDKVKAAMDGHAHETHERTGFSPNTFFGPYPSTYVSRHEQIGAGRPFTLVHLIADLC